MTMKRFCATALLLLWSLCALAVQKSGTIVYINGSKFYVHTVQPGETLYGLSKAYEVGEKVILQHNPAAAQGLRAGESIKIPFVSDVPQPKSERKLRKTFDIHTVTQGETLYGISRKYEIPIQTVIEDNPNLDPVHLRLGERILIRKKEIGSEDEAGTREQWEAYRNSLNSVAEEGFAYHIVKPGETFYSLSRRFGITEDRLGTLNGGLKPADLKAGAIIKVPGLCGTARSRRKRPAGRQPASAGLTPGDLCRQQAEAGRIPRPAPQRTAQGGTDAADGRRQPSPTATTSNSTRASCWGWTACGRNTATR